MACNDAPSSLPSRSPTHRLTSPAPEQSRPSAAPPRTEIRLAASAIPDSGTLRLTYNYSYKRMTPSSVFSPLQCRAGVSEDYPHISMNPNFLLHGSPRNCLSLYYVLNTKEMT